MTNDELIARARSVVGKGCRYQMGHGGYQPGRDVPWDNEMMCDCSGFVPSWVFMAPRHIDHPFYQQFNHGWVDTTAIVRDAKSTSGFFTEVPLEAARPGDLIVYGTIKREDGTKRQGHVGLITEVVAGRPSKAVHCSHGNERRFADAIQETSAGLWLATDGIVARYAESA